MSACGDDRVCTQGDSGRCLHLHRERTEWHGALRLVGCCQCREALCSFRARRAKAASSAPEGLNFQRGSLLLFVMLRMAQRSARFAQGRPQARRPRIALRVCASAPCMQQAGTCFRGGAPGVRDAVPACVPETLPCPPSDFSSPPVCRRHRLRPSHRTSRLPWLKLYR
jgi:hypothetical protein